MLTSLPNEQSLPWDGIYANDKHQRHKPDTTLTELPTLTNVSQIPQGNIQSDLLATVSLGDNHERY